MLLKEYIETPCGLRFMLDSLNLMSSYSRRRLLSRQMMLTKDEIEGAYLILKNFYSTINVDSSPQKSALVATLKHRLSSLREIDGTLARLTSKSVLDDVDLFEIKHLALLSIAVAEDLKGLDISSVQLPDCNDALSILDPDGLKIDTFYVYDSYSANLTKIRGELLAIKVRNRDKADLISGEITSEDELELLEQERIEEGRIRAELSDKLRNYANALTLSLNTIADIDILIAQVQQIRDFGLCFPKISDNGVSEYTGMFHPYIIYLYNKENEAAGRIKKEFTPIDFKFSHECISIIGANMGGKSVLLKMLAMNQILFQFGFGVAASECSIDIKEGVEVCMENEGGLSSGLSSFAAEIRAIDRVIKRCAGGEKILALVDEPARTTNPIEGSALVGALLALLKQWDISLILTTHYNVRGEFFKRYKVNGLSEGKMDYRLRETTSADVPCEALNVAKSLGVSDEWIQLAQNELTQVKNVSYRYEE